MSIALRLVAGLLAGGLLVGCGSGDDTAGPAEDPTTSDPGGPTTGESVPPGPVDFTQIALVSESNVDGAVSPRAVALDGEAAVDEFAGRFSGPRMVRSLSAAYERADVPDGEVLAGAVVDVSCTPPREVEVEMTGKGLRVTAVPVASKVQCLVPVTTVALVAVPESAF